METGFMNRITGLVIALVVGGLLVGGLLIPSIEGMTATEKTLENEGYFHMEKYGTDTDLTITWDHTNPKKINVNGDDFEPNTPLNQWVSVAIGDNWFFRYADGGANTYVQVTYGGANYLSGSVTAGSDVIVTCENGTATLKQYSGDTVTNTQTVAYTEIYAISGDSGSYVMKKSTETAYMAGNTEFIGLGQTGMGETGRAVLKVSGNVDDGATVDVIASTPAGATVSDIEVNVTSLTDYIGFALSTITFTLAVEGTDYPATYSYFIVPAKVTLELSQHMDATQIAMFGVISILGIVALVVVAANGIRNKY